MSELHIIGNHQWREIETAVPEWGVEEESCFVYKGQQHFLSEFMICDHHADLSDYHGYRSDTYFSGLLVRLHDSGDAVQVYRYYS